MFWIVFLKLWIACSLSEFSYRDVRLALFSTLKQFCRAILERERFAAFCNARVLSVVRSLMPDRDCKEANLAKCFLSVFYLSSTKKIKNELQKCKFRFAANSADINRMGKLYALSLSCKQIILFYAQYYQFILLWITIKEKITVITNSII